MSDAGATEKKDRSSAGKAATGFSARNYLLLIIALIALICLSLGLALAFGSANLSNGQKWFITGFLSMFALLSVSIVTWLVIRHSKKLAIAAFDESLEWRTTSPERQKRRLNAEVRELAGVLNVGEASLAELRAAYIVAEDLALRRVQNESAIHLMRKVSIGSADFDAVLVNKDLVTCISVAFLVRPEIPDEKVKRLLREANVAKNIVADMREGSRLRLLLILVTQLDRQDEAKLRSTIVDYFKTTPVDIDIRWMDFGNLQSMYSDE